MRKAPGFLVRLLGLVAIGAVNLAAASVAFATWNPVTGCDVHLRRAAAANFNYAEICTPEAVDALAAPGSYPTACEQHPDVPGPGGAPGCPGADWPVVLQGYPPASNPNLPDRGFRYPLVRIPVPPGLPGPDDTTQLLGFLRLETVLGELEVVTSRNDEAATDEWPVCVSEDESAITSDPRGPQSCPAGYRRVGICRAAAHHYERLATVAASRPAQVFYSFVHDERECTPCGHEVVSTIETCKHLCRRYFGQLRFDGTQPGNGRWVVDPSSQTSLANFTLASEEQRTPLEACVRNCGPPDPSVPAHLFGDMIGGEVQPPWVSTLGVKTSAEKDNHWHFVQYGRGWNPNDNLDNWLRSYSVNRDKSKAPANRCQDFVNAYCNQVAGSTAKKQECKKALLRLTPAEGPLGPEMAFVNGSWQLDLPGDPRSDPNVSCGSTTDGTPDGFCTHFFRGNMLCPDTCYFRGNDGELNAHHLCGEESQNACLGGSASYCHETSATCAKCKGPGGAPGPCPTIDLISPALDANGEVHVNGSSTTIIAVLRDGVGNVLTGPPANGRWASLTTGTLGEMVWYFAWASPAIALEPGDNSLLLVMSDQYGNGVSRSFVAIR